MKWSGHRFWQFVRFIFVGWAWQRSFVFNNLFKFYFCRLSLTENCQRPQWTQLTLITWWENQTTNFSFAIQLFWCMFHCILWRTFYRWKSKNPIYLHGFKHSKFASKSFICCVNHFSLRRGPWNINSVAFFQFEQSNSNFSE